MAINDNTRKLLAEIEKRSRENLLKAALIVERDAKKNCPVKTGHLRRSITHVLSPNGKEAAVGSNVEYAKFVELGTRKMAARPFLRNALRSNLSKIRKIFKGK